MSRHQAPRSRVRAVIAGAVLLALGATVAVVALVTGKDDVVEPVVKHVAVVKLTEIERLAPPDTSQLVLTPGVGQDNQWWNTLIAFMPPQVRLDNLKPTSDLGITHLGYSLSAGDPALKLDHRYARMLYVETESAQHAKSVEGWLSSSIGAAQGAFSTVISGHTVILAIPNTPELAELPKGGDGLGSTAAYLRDTAKRKPGSLIWEDWGAHVKAAGASSGKPIGYSKFFSGATGFIKDSRWVGYSPSPQIGWSGKFQSGGMDSKLVSATDVNAFIQSFNKAVVKDADGRPLISDLGAGAYLQDSFYAMHQDLKAPQATMGSADLAFKPKSEGDTAFAFEPSAWLAGTSPKGISSPEGISLFAYSIKGSQVSLKVIVNETIKAAGNEPVQTFAPPPPPEPGSIPIQVGKPDNSAAPTPSPSGS